MSLGLTEQFTAVVTTRSPVVPMSSTVAQLLPLNPRWHRHEHTVRPATSVVRSVPCPLHVTSAEQCE